MIGTADETDKRTEVLHPHTAATSRDSFGQVTKLHATDSLSLHYREIAKRMRGMGLAWWI